MYVIGTAGHVDHGKSTLVHALTGIDPDRLREEKEREMTIDLGFAWLKLPSGREVSIVDVPGHERFIKNMLAGVGGIDAALLVVAADEGPMPQTEEHLSILDLLQIESGVVALTKSDLVDDEWLEMVREDVAERLSGTSLAGAEIVPVSSRTGQGLGDLLRALDAVLDKAMPRQDRGRPRLPVDRVFSISGFGTVATGTLIDGKLEVGQEIEVQPKGLKTRVRGLQVHKHKAAEALPGNRVAVNVSNLAVEDLARGDVLTTPGWLKPAWRLDVKLRVLAHAPKDIEQNDTLDFFTGAAEVPASLTLLDKEKLEPGEEGWVQLRLAGPVAVAKGDRFILRQASPSLTVGGGVVIDTGSRRHRRFRPEVIASLETLARGSPAELLLQALESPALQEFSTVAERAGLDSDIARQSLRQLLSEGRALVVGRPAGEAVDSNGPILPGDLVAARSSWERLVADAAKLLSAYHAQYPLRKGMPKEEFKSRMGLSPKGLAAFTKQAVAGGQMAERNGTYALPAHKVRFTAAQQERVDKLQKLLAAEPFSPPSVGDMGVDPETLAALQDDGVLTKVSDSVYFLTTAFLEMRDRILKILDENGSITVAGVRDEFHTSRKYALSLLEYLDEQKVTRRVGDERVRR
ncbi:MAG: selenocysteine-specific translation elongation factor [Chloroflexi bacterium]|nr:selenocysteine-specific translation elongation factor [Chloroflexota bacterium]